MRELSFATGLVSYKVNGGAEIRFNPADSAFVGRLFNTFDGLAKRQDQAEIENQEMSGAELFAAAEQRNKEMRQEIDSIFGEPVCEKVFGNQDVYALADGLPLWCNFLMAVIDEVDASVTAQQNQASPRVQHYMAKYAKYNKR